MVHVCFSQGLDMGYCLPYQTHTSSLSLLYCHCIDYCYGTATYFVKFHTSPIASDLGMHASTVYIMKPLLLKGYQPSACLITFSCFSPDSPDILYVAFKTAGKTLGEGIEGQMQKVW